MEDEYDSVHRKVHDIFTEIVGERAKRLFVGFNTPAMDALSNAITTQASEGHESAADVAFHMLEWSEDAAFLMALHLFPERFTPEEIDAGIGLFLCHAPNHIREACRLTGNYVWEDWPEGDLPYPGQRGDPPI